MKILTLGQVNRYLGRQVVTGTPVRFMNNKKSYNIITGKEYGGNVINQLVYWHFDKNTAKEIAQLTNTKAIF